MKIILCDDCGFTVHESEDGKEEESFPYASDFISELLAENAKLKKEIQRLEETDNKFRRGSTQ